MLKSGTLNDIEMFENIISSINVSYRKLTELEFKNLKESKEYKEELENLKSCITIEENILERFKVSGDLEEIISYIEKKHETKVGININFSCKEGDIKKARISNDLHQIRISQILNGEDFPSALYVTSIYNDIIKLALAIFDINNQNETLEYDDEFDAYITVTIGNKQPTANITINKTIELIKDADLSLVRL